MFCNGFSNMARQQKKRENLLQIMCRPARNLNQLDQESNLMNFFYLEQVNRVCYDDWLFIVSRKVIKIET